MEAVNAPRLSPDGRQVIFTRRYVNKLEDRFDAALWIMNADGSHARMLTKGANAVWSPDGSRIAYVAEGEPRGTQVFVRWMDAEGATSQVTHADEAPGDLRWSPDGKWIGFSMFVPTPRVWKIDMPEAPKGAKWTAPPRYVTTLHFKQDGRGFTEPGNRHLFVVPADGGTPRAVTSGNWHVGARFDALDGGVAWDWMPDGRSVVFEGFADTTSDMNYRNSYIYTTDVAGCAATCPVRRLTTAEGAWSAPVVSPDGRRIAYRGYSQVKDSYHTSELFVMNADGSGAQKISGALDRDIGHVNWAKDGVLYFSVQDHATANIYTSSPSGDDV
jgi:Tol biopolymer transport system component